jgi:GTP pyrophosphokinase
MPLRHELQNGDQVEVMTSRGGTPSPQWERFVVTGKARARIRRYVQQQQRQLHLDAGKAALAKAFRQEGVDGSEKILDGALKALKQPSVADLYAAVGANTLAPRDVVVAAYPELRQAPRGPRMPPPMQNRLGTRPPGRPANDLPVSGLVPGMEIHYAGCCHPLPGDRIVGIVATGKGVTIHTKDCPTLAGFAATPERFIDVDWEASAFATALKKGEGYTGRLSVIVSNTPSALATITNAVAKQDGSIANLRVTNRQADFFEVMVDVEVRDVRHLATVIAGLRASADVHQVERARG